MNKKNLTKLRNHLNGPLIPGFNMNNPACCACAEAEKLFKTDTVWDDRGNGPLELNREEFWILFDMAEAPREFPYLNMEGKPSDQYLVAKNIDILLSNEQRKSNKNA